MFGIEHEWKPQLGNFEDLNTIHFWRSDIAMTPTTHIRVTPPIDPHELQHVDDLTITAITDQEVREVPEISVI